jgi:hypothetical protein
VLQLLAEHMPNPHRVLYFGEVVTLAALTTAQMYESLRTSASAEGNHKRLFVAGSDLFHCDVDAAVGAKL